MASKQFGGMFAERLRRVRAGNSPRANSHACYLLNIRDASPLERVPLGFFNIARDILRLCWDNFCWSLRPSCYSTVSTSCSSSLSRRVLITVALHSAAFSTYEREWHPSYHGMSCSNANRILLPDLSHLKALGRPEGSLPADVRISIHRHRCLSYSSLPNILSRSSSKHSQLSSSVSSEHHGKLPT